MKKNRLQNEFDRYRKIKNFDEKMQFLLDVNIQYGFYDLETAKK